MDERFYRGAQPKEEDFKNLAQLGIRTIIDLREDPEPYEKPMVESLGMTYVNIPMIAAISGRTPRLNAFSTPSIVKNEIPSVSKNKNVLGSRMKKR